MPKKKQIAPPSDSGSTDLAGAPAAPPRGAKKIAGDALRQVPQRAMQAVRAPADPPRTHRELAEAIFAQCDPIAVGRELLESGSSEKGGSVKARIWETLVEFLLGKPAPTPAKQEPIVQIIWELPGPEHDPDDP